MTPATQEQKSQVIARYGHYVSPGRVAFFEAAGMDFVMGRRDGAYMWDITGEKRLIDCHCNGGVFNLGHRHPELVATLVEGLQHLDIGNHHLISEQRGALGARLAELLPGDINFTVFGVGGGEANDLAIKVARAYTGRRKIISARGGYHGHTGLSLAAGDAKYYRAFGPPAPGFTQVPFGDTGELEAALDDDTAAVIMETIPATSGMPIPPSDYYPTLRDLCDRAGALLIIDEVQTGLGRTGRLWGIDHFDIVPDIVVLGKGLSGGLYPITATCLRRSLGTVFDEDPFIHISTFGGAEVGCAVALAVLDICADPVFLEQVNDMAARFTAHFERLREKYPGLLVRLRQLGLMMGIEMVNDYCGPIFSKAAYDQGLLSIYANNDKRVAQLLPPLIADAALVEEIVERVDAALGQVANILA